MSKLDEKIAERIRDLSEEAGDCESVLLPNESPGDWLDETQVHPNGFIACSVGEILRFLADMM